MAEKKEMNVWWALLPLVIMVTVMIFTIIVLEQEPHIPLMIGTIAAALVAWKHGFKWKDIEQMMYKGIRLALPAIIIIMLVGLTIGAWIGGGVVASMIYYGLKVINPAFFLVTITIICAVVSLVVGSSWATMGTIGVAGMGIGLSMGIPAPMIAGAVISGAYFGDKMSPLSDTTNLAAGLTHTDLFEHIKHMFYTTIPGIVIALIVYFFLGRQFKTSVVGTEDIDQVIAALQEHFVISPFLLLVPVIVIVLVMRKVPAAPALVVGIILGYLAQIFVQGGSASFALEALQSGYTLESGNFMVDELFNRGGLDSMMYTVSMTIVAMTFGGILEFSGMLESIMNHVLKLIKSTGALIASTIGAAFFTNASCSEQYISIVVPSRMFAKAYQERGLQSKNLSRALEDGGTLTSVFIPWNTCGVFIFGTLGVHAFAYAPYAIFNLIVPIISIIFAFTGYTIAKLSKEEQLQLQKQQEEAI
ncbi:MAG TPA: Na+/H+ antiporter NhaC [Virgibacillus sp.]|nr:Na+/H+ antiporter NhaC [Virgibacillus sp.]